MPQTNSQLSATGPQDELLTGDPEVTFWQTNPRRHTPFALEAAEVPFQGTADFGRRVTATTPRSIGDLLKGVWLQITVPNLTQYSVEPTSATNVKWVNSIAYAVISSNENQVGKDCFNIDLYLLDYGYGKLKHQNSLLTKKGCEAVCDALESVGAPPIVRRPIVMEMLRSKTVFFMA